MIKERPILFNGEMVRAILDGRKTQTRRAVKYQPEQQPILCTNVTNKGQPSWVSPTVAGCLIQICPFGKPGDRLWVRESAKVQWVKSGIREAGIKYMADGAEAVVAYPSRLAPAPVGKLLANGTYREASRILLEVTAVRVERLQDISDEDARAEGVERAYNQGCPVIYSNDYVASFKWLWDSIYSTWDQNPWVWVVDFERIKP